MAGGGGAAAVRLIVNADDFGASAAVNRGVAVAHRDGIVTSASLLAAGAAFDDALALIEDTPTLAVGVHLALVDGPAAAPRAAPSLVDADGLLPVDAGAFVRRYFGGKISLGDVRAELGAQIARVAAAGVRITHLDSHQHLHNLPGVAAVVIALARAWRVAAVRRCRCRLWPMARAWLGRQLTLRLCAEAFGAAAARAGLKMPDGLEGQPAAGTLDEGRLVKIIAGLGPGTWELLCHPAAGAAADAPPGYDRAGELAALTSARVRAALAERGVKLVNYAAL